MNMHKFNLLYAHVVRLLLLIFPDAPIIMRFRGFLYSFVMQKCGKNFQVAASAILRGLEKISCGDNVYVGPNAYIMSRKKIVISSEVLIAMNVVIVDGNHGKNIATNSYRFERGRQELVVIGQGAWIAANSVVTAGAVVADGELVPPCSVVRKERCKQ